MKPFKFTMYKCYFFTCCIRIKYVDFTTFTLYTLSTSTAQDATTYSGSPDVTTTKIYFVDLSDIELLG